MFRKVSNSDIFYMASFHHVMISAKIISLKLWPKAKFLCHLKLLKPFIYLFFFKFLCTLNHRLFSQFSYTQGLSWKADLSNRLDLYQQPDISAEALCERLIFSF